MNWLTVAFVLFLPEAQAPEGERPEWERVPNPDVGIPIDSLCDRGIMDCQGRGRPTREVFTASPADTGAYPNYEAFVRGVEASRGKDEVSFELLKRAVLVPLGRPRYTAVPFESTADLLAYAADHHLTSGTVLDVRKQRWWTLTADAQYRLVPFKVVKQGKR